MTYDDNEVAWFNAYNEEFQQIHFGCTTMTTDLLRSMRVLIKIIRAKMPLDTYFGTEFNRTVPPDLAHYFDFVFPDGVFVANSSWGITNEDNDLTMTIDKFSKGTVRVLEVWRVSGQDWEVRFARVPEGRNLLVPSVSVTQRWEDAQVYKPVNHISNIQVQGSLDSFMSDMALEKLTM